MSAEETLAALADGLVTEAEAVEQLMVDDLAEAYEMATVERLTVNTRNRAAAHRVSG